MGQDERGSLTGSEKPYNGALAGEGVTEIGVRQGLEPFHATFTDY
jgi:hypothetical protein